MAALLLAILATAPGAAQRAKDSLSETVDVRVVNVDVVVLDRRGQPITGLTADDFVLEEDGRPVEISSFFAYRRGEAAPAPDLPPTGGRTGAQPPDSSAPPLLALYLDRRNTPAHQTARVLRDLRAFLDDLPPGERRLMLASYTDRLEVLVPPTRDVAPILAALDRVEESAGSRGLQPLLDQRSARQQIMADYEACEGMPACEPCQDNWENMLQLAGSYARKEENRTAAGVVGMAEMVGALSGIDSRKMLLYVGGGFQQRPGISMLSYVGQLCSRLRSTAENDAFREILTFDETTRLGELAAYANANRVTLYTLDAGGLDPGSASDVAYGDRRFVPSSDNDQVRVANIQNTLFSLARDTGGQAILNANRPLEDLRGVLEHLDGAYSLGFVPAHPPTGQVHYLEVRLDEPRRGTTLRYRRSYVDQPLESRLASRLISALYLDAEENALGMQIAFEPSTRVVRKVHDVPIRISVPAAAFLRVPDGSGTPSGRARLWLTARSERGDQSGMRQELIRLGGEGGLAPEDGFFRFVVTMPLTEGRQTVAVGIRDEVGQETSVLRREIEIPLPTASYGQGGDPSGRR